MHPYPLSSLKAGITRSRTKGGASAQALYDLLNGYVNEAGAPVSRDGSLIDGVLPAGTKGLMSYLGQKMVFATQLLDMTGTGYVLQIIKHPTIPTAQLVKIHYAKSFLRYPYVIAEFDDGAIYHFWLQEAQVWNASTVYSEGSVVLPAVPSGFAYIAQRASAAAPLWTPNKVRAVGDKVEPSIGNGYYAEVISVQGSAPASGDTEPAWPAEEGALVVEEAGGNPAVPSTGSSTATTGSPVAAVPNIVTDRYGGVPQA